MSRANSRTKLSNRQKTRADKKSTAVEQEVSGCHGNQQTQQSACDMPIGQERKGLVKVKQMSLLIFPPRGLGLGYKKEVYCCTQFLQITVTKKVDVPQLAWKVLSESATKQLREIPDIDEVAK